MDNFERFLNNHWPLVVDFLFAVFVGAWVAAGSGYLVSWPPAETTMNRWILSAAIGLTAAMMCMIGGFFLVVVAPSLLAAPKALIQGHRDWARRHFPRKEG